MERGIIASHLRGSRLYGPTGPEVVELAAGCATSRVLAARQELWREGQSARSFTVIISGFVEIVRELGAD